MPRDGSGNYTLPPGYLATPGTTIFDTQHNGPLEDIAQELTGSLPVDGSKVMSGDLPFAPGKTVLLGKDGTGSEAVRASQVYTRSELYTRSETDDLLEQATINSGNLALARTADISRYDRAFMRVVPSISVWEPWSLAPDLIEWQDITGARARVTEASIRERVRSEARLGIRGIWFKYVEIFGHWFTKPAFALWDDRDQVAGALTPGKQWYEFPNNFAEYLADDFDMLAVVIDECARNGLFILIGLGRVGLFNTLSYYQTGTGGYTGPAALTQAAQMTLAIDRTRQMHADIVTRFSAYRQWILSLSSGFEPDQMATWKVFSAGVTAGAGTHPTVRDAGYQWWCSPAEMDELPAVNADLTTRGTFAQDLIDCNADVWIVQDAVGPGFNPVTERNTYVASQALGQLDDYYSRWRRSLDDAGLAFGSILEHWRMGSEPTTNITLSSLSGPAVTATSSFGFFTAGMIGKYLTGADAGNARITAVASATVATIDTNVTATGAFAAGAAFASTSLPAGSFSLNDGYSNPYPADPARIASQMAIHSKYSDEICMYGTSSFTVDDTLTLRLPQSLAGLTDYRTRAKTLFDDGISRLLNGLVRERRTRNRLPIVKPFKGSAVTPTGGSYSETIDRYSPAAAWSKIIVRMIVTAYRGKTANAFVNDVTIRLQVNGVNVGDPIFTGGEDGVFSGTFHASHVIANTGAAITVGYSMTWQTAAGNPTISAVEWVIEEIAP